MKKILSALCILSLMIACLPLYSAHASAEEITVQTMTMTAQPMPTVGQDGSPIPAASLPAASGTKLPANSVTSKRTRHEVYELYKNSQYSFSTSDLFEKKPVLKAGSYSPGKLSSKAKNLTLAQLNYMRTLYGVNTLKIYKDKIDDSQYGATGLEITGKLTHYFSEDDLATLKKYMTQKQIDLACDAISAGIEYRGSDVYLWNGNCSSSNNVVADVKSYIDDTANVYAGVGHRFNLLCLIGTEVTFGASLNKYSCMSIYGNPFDYDNNEAFYAWPAEGYFPRLSMADNALWSVELGRKYSVDQNALTISLAYKGKTYKGSLVVLDSHDNGAHDAITFSIPSDLISLIKASSSVYNNGGQADVKVTIKGLKDGSNDCYLQYTTSFFIDDEFDGNLVATTPTLVNTAKGIKVTFSKVRGATHYEIYRKLKASDKGDPVESKYTKVTTIADSNNTSSKINYYDSATATGKNGNTYVYYIRPVIKENGSIVKTGPTKNVQIRRVSTPEIKSITNSSAGAVTLKWSKNSLATGYDVWYSDGKTKKTLRSNSNTTLSITITGLTKGKTYTFKVRSYYKTSSGTIYKSAWKPAEITLSR